MILKITYLFHDWYRQDYPDEEREFEIEIEKWAELDEHLVDGFNMPLNIIKIEVVH